MYSPRTTSANTSPIRQDLVKEDNTKRRLGYKLIDHSDRPNKLKFPYKQTVYHLDEEIPMQLRPRNKIVPSAGIFFEDQLKQSREYKASLDYHSLAYISKVMQPTNNAAQSNALNERESINIHPTDKPVAQTVQTGATSSYQDRQVATRLGTVCTK